MSQNKRENEILKKYSNQKGKRNRKWMEPWENEQQDGRLKPNHTKITLNINSMIESKRLKVKGWEKYIMHVVGISNDALSQP